MATLSDMVSHIKSDLARNGSVDDAQIKNCIRSALRFYRARAFWFLSTTNSYTLSDSSSTMAAPATFGRLIDLRLVVGGRLVRLTKCDSREDLEQPFISDSTPPSGQPAAYALQGNTFYFDRTADGDITVRLDFYAKDETLPASDGDTSIWFDEGYDVIRARARSLFKRESEEWDVTSVAADEANANYYYRQLEIEHNNRLGG